MALGSVMKELSAFTTPRISYRQPQASSCAMVAVEASHNLFINKPFLDETDDFAFPV
jgi:hypothetical protein